MSSFTTSDPQNRAQRRLLFEGFNVQDMVNNSRRPHHPKSMLTSTPDHKLYETESDQHDLLASNDASSQQSCLLQLQNARQLLHSMSRTNAPSGTGTTEQPLIDDALQRPELLAESNPELAYYKSSLESERTRRKQLETLIDVQQQRLTEVESELAQLRANDVKKTTCMKQLEQMIPNVVDEWKQKENDYKIKFSSLSQQFKQVEQVNHDRILIETQQFEERLIEKNSTIDRLSKDLEQIKQDYDLTQAKSRQHEQRAQQTTKDFEQAKQRWSTLEVELRSEISRAESRLNDVQSELDNKRQEIEQITRDQIKSNSDHQAKVRQMENELDEQRRDNNVLKMELELREAKYRAQTESLRIQLIRESEAKLTQRLDEQQTRHLRIEEELNELQRRKLADFQEKHEQLLANERTEYETRVQTLLNKLEQMKIELERVQSATMAERQDLARKLQDVFETTILKGSTTTNSFPSSETSPRITTARSKSQFSDTQNKGSAERHEFLAPLPLANLAGNNDSTSMSAMRSLSSRIDSLVNETNRVANGLDLNHRLPPPPPLLPQQQNNTERTDTNLLTSRPPSALPSPFFRSTPIDPMHEWFPQTVSQLPLDTVGISRSQSADRDGAGTSLTTFSSHSRPQPQQQLNSYSLDSNLHTSQRYFQEPHSTNSKDSIDRQQDDIQSTNESLTRYVKMLLDRSPTEHEKTLSNLHPSEHPLSKTNRSLHDIRVSIDQLQLVERDSNLIVDDLAHMESNSSRLETPRQHKQHKSMMAVNGGGVKKRLDYDDAHSNKQCNTTELFDRLAQPKTRIKRDKTKQQSHQTTGAHGTWK